MLGFQLGELNGQLQVYIGAGISTSAGVRNFRGPSGIWSLHAKDKTVAGLDFPEVCNFARSHCRV